MGLIALIVNTLKNKTSIDEKYSYTKRNILTKTEQEFYIKLKELVADKYYIFPQIHLASILSVEAHNRNWKRLFNKIIQKSVDFVLVDIYTFETKLVIELDDKTHLQTNRIERDGFVDKSLKSAQVAILHVTEINENILLNTINSLTS